MSKFTPKLSKLILGQSIRVVMFVLAVCMFWSERGARANQSVCDEWPRQYSLGDRYSDRFGNCHCTRWIESKWSSCHAKWTLRLRGESIQQHRLSDRRCQQHGGRYRACSNVPILNSDYSQWSLRLRDE